MPRTRSIKPEFWDDEKLARQHSLEARLVYIGLWTYCDDYGTVKGDTEYLRSKYIHMTEASTKSLKSG